MVAKARVCTTFQTGTNPAGTDITIEDGSVHFDANAEVRGTLDLVTSQAWDSLLTPYGNEIFVQRGIQYGQGDTELVSQGYFRIQTADQDDAPDGMVRITGLDRMSAIAGVKVLNPIQFNSTDTVGTFVSTLFSDVYPSITIQWDDSTNTQQIGRQIIVDDDRYPFIEELLTSYGKIFYFDYRGFLIIKSPPDPSTSVFDVNYGKDGVLLNLKRRLTREGVFNGVRASGQGVDGSAPVFATAIDNNPSSLTYWYGTFGKVVEYFESPFLNTNGQCLTAAQSLLTQRKGLPYSASFRAVPNPALEVYDCIRVSTKSAMEMHVLDTIDLSLVARTEMIGDTRQQSRSLFSGV